ncbi:MAG: FAD-dependent monooxygenase [Firmicutes bacterium]|nr:FAD-dependent monooxygenase [Alicyclobacillaceae bacterium]MCL6497628.1 FAD-dependent monooxygenase [Bacillota bacterium]
MDGETRPVVVIGGGIGGLSAALALAHVGVSSTVLEQSPAFTEIGAGLQLAPNAMRVLDRLGLMEGIRQVAWFPQRLVLGDAKTGQELSWMDLGEAFRRHYGQPYAVMHRADLLDLLVQGCRASGRVELLPQKAVVKISPDADGVTVVCQDGSWFRARGAVAADGLWSKTRRRFSDDEPVRAEYVAYRGTVPIEAIRDLARMDDVVMWISPELHFVQYPVRRGELYNQVAVFRSHRFRPDSDDWGTPEELDEAFAVCCEPIRRAVEFMQRGRRWPMVDRVPIARWTDGRVALLGDAAHAMLQYIAQGACQAIEDAAALAEQVQLSGGDLQSAFFAYQAARVARAAAVQSAARQFGHVIHTQDPTAIAVRDYFLRRRRPDDFSATDWIYAHDPAPHL